MPAPAAKSPTDNKLQDYRAPASVDNIPHNVEDDATSRPAATAPEPHELANQADAGRPLEGAREAEPAEIKTVADPRLELARKFARDRATEREQLVTPRAHVPAIQGDLDENGHLVAREEAQEGEGQQQEQVAAPEANNQLFALKVDGNTFSVNHDDLLRYAEVTSDEAADFTDAQLVKLAQKQIAASLRLEQARQERESARHSADRQSGEQVQQQPAANPAQPSAELVEALREVQYGDPEVAAAKINRIMADAIDQRTREAVQTTTMAAVEQELRVEAEHAIRDFQAARPDIVQDEFKTLSHAGLMAREIANDLMAAVPTMMDPQKFAAISTNPRVAVDCLQAALREGYKVRRPSQILADAAKKLDQAFSRGVGADGLSPNPSSAAPAQPTRQDLKRALPQTPARSGTPPQQIPHNQTDDRSARSRSVFEQIRKSRHQG